MIEVWGRSSSSNAAKVFWTLDELKLDYALHKAGGEFGGLEAPAYLAMNPNGRVPTLVDDGLVLWESNAVVRYLAAQYGAGSLWPVAARERALSDKWMDWATVNFAAALAPLRQKRTTGGADTGLAAAADRVDRLAGMLDRTLSASPYIGGVGLGIGDVALGPHVHRWTLLDIPPDRHPALRSYYLRLCTHGAYKRHIVDKLA
ncbi:glutathione S-transferase family protein [Achromobacter aloeverae]|uniref:Glutathione S-transferase n=1 Tax=Achromobacter aloeverae TaxID=1750518 RepID=A0A4Q1HD36_9BURK|nr:glutathione S-transferase N-terminal domain-containing protein [Achromobacter aloeverae]RXN83796.1 glutathione S-transferase [Achromobacter aloeverae]